MSEIANRIGSRYNDILSYFRRNPFGSIPGDMTVLSVLPPVDRCLILERVFVCGDGYTLALVDKLSMAYMKAGWLDIGRLLIRRCCDLGIIDDYVAVEFVEKIVSLSNLRISAATYEDALRALPQYEVFGGGFAPLIRALCEDYFDMNVYQGVDFVSPIWSTDVRKFLDERLSFVRRIGSVV